MCLNGCLKSLLVLGLLFVLACSTGERHTEETAESPSVLLITVDTLRADRLGSYGYRLTQTPHLDGLAEDAVLFEKAVTPVPLTLPAHASLMTGTYPLYHGIRTNSGFVLPEEVDTLAEAFKEAGYRTGAAVGAFVLDSRFGLDQGFDTYADGFQTETLELVSQQIAEHRAEDVVDRALTWLAQVPGGETFFYWLHLFDPHAPYSPPPPLADGYDGEITYVDIQLNRIFESLKSEGTYEDSVVVFTADHGEGLGDHGEATHGLFLYDSTLHVPLIFKLPGQEAAGKRVASTVSLIDVMPTLLELAGIRPPEGVQGKSLRRLWQSPDPPSPRSFYAETLLPRLDYGWSSLQSVRKASYVWISAPTPELYHLDQDPGQQTNLHESRQAFSAGMQEELEDVVRHFSAELARNALTDTDSEATERLRSLGYAAISRESPPLLSTDLPDPKSKIEVFNQIQDAQAAAAAGNPQESIRRLSTVLATDPSIFVAHSLQGLNYLQVGRPQQALRHLREAVRLHPEDSSAHLYLGRAYIGVENLEAAAEAFRKSLAASRENKAARNNLGAVLIQMGNYSEAAEIFSAITRENPEDAAAWLNLGVLLVMERDFANAESALEKAITLRPDLPQAYNNLGLVYLNWKQPARAQKSFMQALRLNPDYENARRNLAEAYRQMGLPEEAEKLLESSARP